MQFESLVVFQVRPWQTVTAVVGDNLVKYFQFTHTCAITAIEDIDKEKASVGEEIPSLGRSSCFSLLNSQMLGRIAWWVKCIIWAWLPPSLYGFDQGT